MHAANNNRISSIFTASNLEWKELLAPDPDSYRDKNIITKSKRFLAGDKRVKIFSSVIMDNHLHLIWQILPYDNPEAVQRDFLKYTA